MNEEEGCIKRVYSDYRTVSSFPRNISTSYLPYYYQGLLDAIPEGTSDGARKRLTSYKGRAYVKGINFLHKMLAHEYGDENLKDNPKFLHVQILESDSWLLIKQMDEAADELSRQGNYDAIVKMVEHVETSIFGDSRMAKHIPLLAADAQEAIDILTAKLRKGLEAHSDMMEFRPIWDALMKSALAETQTRSMEEYRKVRREVATDSAKLSSFFIGGAGDTTYSKQHFADRLTNMHQSAEKIGVSGQFLDNYLDFYEDKEESMRALKTRPGDRSWFLYAGIRQAADLILHEQRKHLGSFAGGISVHLGAMKLMASPSKFNDHKIAHEEFIKELTDALTGHSPGPEQARQLK